MPKRQQHTQALEAEFRNKLIGSGANVGRGEIDFTEPAAGSMIPTSNLQAIDHAMKLKQEHVVKMASTPRVGGGDNMLRRRKSKHSSSSKKGGNGYTGVILSIDYMKNNAEHNIVIAD